MRSRHGGGGRFQHSRGDRHDEWWLLLGVLCVAIAVVWGMGWL